MINETIVLLSPYEDCSKHRLSQYVGLWLSVPFDECFYQPLQKIFSKVILYDYLKRMVEVGVTGVNQEIIKLVSENRPKYVLWAAFAEGYEVQESTFDAIRQKGTKIVGWFFDDEVRFDFYSKWWVPHLDYVVTNDSEAVPKYRELSAWVTHGIPDTGSAPKREQWDVKEKYDVSFIGSTQADRLQYIQALKGRNIPVHLLGARWGGFVPYEEMMEIFGTSKINLNFSKTYKYMKFGIKGRIFKVCLSGGFLLTEYVPGIEKFFEIDREIVCFHNQEEMVDKVIYYLNHDEERRAIARAGWKRASAEYTSSHIVSRVFQEIEKDSSTGQKSSQNELRMPGRVRKRVSNDYLKWGRAFLLENYRGLWKDALALSTAYYPSHIRAWFWRIIGSLPSFGRLSLIKPYIAAAKLRRKIILQLKSPTLP